MDFTLFRTAFTAPLLFSALAHANVTVTNAFTDHMVVQRDAAVAVQGKARNGESIRVSLGSQSQNAVAGADGNWSVKLDPMAAGGPYTLTLKGDNTIAIQDVMVGEVWQCAGQSNMDTRLSFYPGYADTIKAADLPLLRYYTLRQPGEVTKWQICSPATAGKLSATGFFFGREIQRSQGVAVGLVVTAVGGTFISQWMDPATLASDPVLATNHDTANGNMYRQWVSTVAGYTLRGTVWLQGEQDRSAGLPVYYRDRFQALIKGWRKVWGQGDFPFYFVQLANYGTLQTDPNEQASSAVIREAQRLALGLPNTAMAVAIDIGSAIDLHFPDKRDVGLRLALPAKALLYGQKDLVYSGPMFASKTIEGNLIHLLFHHVGGGLRVKGGGNPKGFAIAGSDNVFVWADAVIHGDTVSVSSSKVAKPTQVRYAYAGNPAADLFNAEGLPASPFQTEGEQLPVSVRAHAAAWVPVAARVGGLHDMLGRAAKAAKGRSDGRRGGGKNLLIRPIGS